ncbi:MAG: Fe-S cluster assembly protein SufD [Bdellovibrionales bacterium]|nr:Fe-S cluster assembly protein SufD [Bdellovibrionales bacterium]
MTQAGLSPFQPLFQERKAGLPAHLIQEREKHFHAFETIGVPTRRHELWKYTSLAHLKDRTFKVPTVGKLDSAKTVAELGLPAHQTLVLESGKLSWSGLNYDWGQGVQVLSRSEVQASPLYPPLAKAEAQFSASKDGMDSLSEAMASDGVVIHVHHDTQVKDPIYILHVTGEAGTHVASKSLVAVETNAELTVCEIFISSGTAIAAEAPLHQSRLNIICSNNSKVNYYRFQNEQEGATHLGTTEALLHKDAQFDAVEMTLGGQVARHDLKVRCLGAGSQVRLWGGWISSDKQIIDHHTEIEHVAGNTQSRQLYKGIMADRSRSVFNGRIYIHPKAQLVNSELLNRNLLMHSTAEIDTKPELEILANDVKASHGATVGQLDPQQLFYLESRAVPRSIALGMLTLGYLEEVLSEKFPVDESSSAQVYASIVRKAISHKLQRLAEREETK